MADHTRIEWADSTFNPWIGCTKVSPACDHCYAEADMDHRRHRVKWGAGQPRSRTSADYWRQPLRWNSEPFWQCPSCGWRGATKYGGTVECGTCGVPAIPARRRVFCASLADVFDNEVEPMWRVDLFKLIALTPNLDWLLLTKRIGNVERMITDAIWWPMLGEGNRYRPLRNVWLGATICNQAEADRDIPKLLAVPAVVRFLSMEPLLGPVDLGWFLRRNVWEDGVPVRGGDYGHGTQLDWRVVGGESGAGARPMHPAWARSLRNQCAAAGVPFLFKQWGEWSHGSQQGKPDAAVLIDGRVLHDWTVPAMEAANRAAPVPPCRPEIMARAGKKAAGRLLDGVEHNGFPEVRHG